MQLHGCAALALIHMVGDEANERIVSAGGIEAVVEAMQTHTQNAQVQVKGCAVLCILADSQTKIKSRIASAGAIEAVVKAMQTHPQNAGVQNDAHAALDRLYRL